jgi:hypothetical protein
MRQCCRVQGTRITLVLLYFDLRISHLPPRVSPPCHTPGWCVLTESACVLSCSNITLLAWVLFYWVLFATLFFEWNQWQMDKWDMQNEQGTAGHINRLTRWSGYYR